MSSKLKPPLDEVIAALRAGRGNQSDAAEILGVSRGDISRHLARSVKLRKAYEEIQAEALDDVERKLMERVDQGDMKAIAFYLKTQGQRRGWDQPSKESAEDDDGFTIEGWKRRQEKRIAAANKSLGEA